jgi:hypothetical protein
VPVGEQTDRISRSAARAQSTGRRAARTCSRVLAFGFRLQQSESALGVGFRFQEASTVPELSRFFGIIIRMYMEVGGPHHVSHFHAYYQEDVGVFSLDPIEMIAGALPRRQRRLVEAWAEIHQAELSEDWARLQAGQPPLPIAPLE